jgi:quercetin 2,3-dioxygenase
MSKYQLHLAETRGHYNHGWLKSYHTFSFAQYFDPDRIHFGALRVLNDDFVASGQGFAKHPHEEMEIVSIPLEGQLEHTDSTGESGIINVGEIQHMSAGTGIWHSEQNPSKEQPVKFLQIWVFPKEKGITPAYHQGQFDPSDRLNKFQTVIAPSGQTYGQALPINQDAYFSLIDLRKGNYAEYTIKKEGNGTYIFVIEGETTVDKERLTRRDGLGISETKVIDFTANTDVQLLVMEVPMAV